jgi:MFS family permease
VFWAIIGGLGASLLLPAMQSLIHGNFAGTAQKRVYALVGASAAIAAAVGPLIGGFITTYLSWRVAFALEAVVIAVVLSGIGLVRDVAYTGPRGIDLVGAAFSVVGMGGVVLGILVWQEGGEAVAAIMAGGVVALGGLAWWLQRRKRRDETVLLDPGLFRSLLFRYGITGQMLQQIALGGTMIALPIFLQMVLEYNAMQAGLTIAPLSLSMFGMALLAGRRAGRRRPAVIIRAGFALLAGGMLVLLPIVPRATTGWYLVVPLIIAGCGLGLLVSQLNNYTLSPISEERVSEAAGVNSAAGSFGLSFGLDAEVMSNTQLEEQIAGQPQDIQDEILDINTDARPKALQVALLVPIDGRPPGPGQLVPHDPPARPGALRGRRGHGHGLTGRRASHLATKAAMTPPRSRPAPRPAVTSRGLWAPT